MYLDSVSFFLFPTSSFLVLPSDLLVVSLSLSYYLGSIISFLPICSCLVCTSFLSHFLLLYLLFYLCFALSRFLLSHCRYLFFSFLVFSSFLACSCTVFPSVLVVFCLLLIDLYVVFSLGVLAYCFFGLILFFCFRFFFAYIPFVTCSLLLFLLFLMVSRSILFVDS